MFHKIYSLRRVDVAFFKDNEQLVGSAIHEAIKVEARFRGSRENRRRKGAVLVRTRTGRGWGEEGGAVRVLVELFKLYNNGDLTEEGPQCHIGERMVERFGLGDG